MDVVGYADMEVPLLVVRAQASVTGLTVGGQSRPAPDGVPGRWLRPTGTEPRRGAQRSGARVRAGAPGPWPDGWVVGDVGRGRRRGSLQGDTSLQVFGRARGRGGRGKNVRRGARMGQQVYLAGWSTVVFGLQEVAV